MLTCTYYIGHCVERESIEDLLERNIAQKKKFVDVVFVADTSVTKQEFKQQIAAIKVGNIYFVNVVMIMILSSSMTYHHGNISVQK